MIFIERLDSLLKDRKISKMQFLKDTGYSKNAYSEWKSGVTKSYMNKIDIIADYFDVSVDYLLGREQPASSFSNDTLEVAQAYEVADYGTQHSVRKLLDLETAPLSLVARGGKTVRPTTPEPSAEEVERIVKEIGTEKLDF